MTIHWVDWAEFNPYKADKINYTFYKVKKTSNIYGTIPTKSELEQKDMYVTIRSRQGMVR